MRKPNPYPTLGNPHIFDTSLYAPRDVQRCSSTGFVLSQVSVAVALEKPVGFQAGPVLNVGRAKLDEEWTNVLLVTMVTRQ